MSNSRLHTLKFAQDVHKSVVRFRLSESFEPRRGCDLLEGLVIASLDRLSEETPLVRPSFGGKCVSIRWIYGTDFQPSSGI